MIRFLYLFLLAALAADCGGSARRPEPATERPQTGPERAPEVVDSRPVIVALGDSLTAGLGVAPDQSYPAKLQKKVDAGGYRYRVVNAGVSGDTSAQGLNRLGVVLDAHPEIVIVALGGNDGLRGLPVAETRRNLEAIIDRLTEDRARVVLAGIEVPPNYGPEYTAAFRGMFRDLAREHRVAFVPFLLEGVAGHAALNLEDGIHPSARGYDIVTENVWRVLEPLLRRPR